MHIHIDPAGAVRRWSEQGRERSIERCQACGHLMGMALRQHRRALGLAERKDHAAQRGDHLVGACPRAVGSRRIEPGQRQ